MRDCLGRVRPRTPTPRLMASKPIYRPERQGSRQGSRDWMCELCAMNERCRELVAANSWVMCEIPDELDYLVMDLEEAA